MANLTVKVKDGQMLMDVEGCQGPLCKTLLDRLRQQLKLKGVKEDEKPEFAQTDAHGQQEARS